MPMIKFIEADLAAQSIPVHSQQPGGAGLIATGAVQNALDEFLFEFIDRFFEMDSALHHLADQSFELVLHCSTLRTKVFRGRGPGPARLAEFAACELPIGFSVL
jgi:hypothetical protein